ncbi:MAG: pilin [Candidatus Paceibacterota bacterium]
MKKRIIFIKKIFQNCLLIFPLFFLSFYKISWANGLTIPNPAGKTSTVWELIERLLTVAFNLAIPLTVGVVVYGGYLYITSLGNEKKIQQAHKALIWGLIGFGVILIAKAVPPLIKEFLTS